MNNIESTKSNGNDLRGPKESGQLTARKIVRIVGWVIAGVFLACFFALIFGLLVKWLWGMTLTPLFNLPQPTYWQAVGLIILARLLFGGIGHHKDAHHSAHDKKWHDRFQGHNLKSLFDPDAKAGVAEEEMQRG